MSFFLMRSTIHSWYEVFPLSFPEVLTQYEGIDFERPAPNVPWIALLIIGGNSAQCENINGAGQKLFRRTGVVQFNIHTEASKGTQQAELYADSISGLFSNVTLSLAGKNQMMFLTASLRSVGVRDGKYLAILSIPFVMDTTD
jgi:hypothetical protein